MVYSYSVLLVRAIAIDVRAYAIQKLTTLFVESNDAGIAIRSASPLRYRIEQRTPIELCIPSPLTSSISSRDAWPLQCSEFFSEHRPPAARAATSGVAPARSANGSPPESSEASCEGSRPGARGREGHKLTRIDTRTSPNMPPTPLSWGREVCILEVWILEAGSSSPPTRALGGCFGCFCASCRGAPWSSLPSKQRCFPASG